MLKQAALDHHFDTETQPPSGGCVLKLVPVTAPYPVRRQPPSGGCVLKHFRRPFTLIISKPAAFGRLCVETEEVAEMMAALSPAAFGRLCVETGHAVDWGKGVRASRLRAAVC